MADTKIISWDIRMCGRCNRNRTHYATKLKRNWQCIGTLPEVRDIVAKCGDPVKVVTNETK